ncbi:MAG: UDP-N-acetylmuramate--L-alanine ligase [Lentisphaerae bacterium]|nr:UDP-N-acetylmuramate--L-alanine ligase [Lentisphaerota bacterium]
MMQTTYNNIVARLTLEPAKAHFVGIGGIGMAGLAYILKKSGWDVSGCDETENHLLEWLSKNGISYDGRNSSEHIADLDPSKDIVIRSCAVSDASPEISAAIEAGVPVYLRGELLAAITGLHNTIAVCGTHGKTTTSSFLAGMLKVLRPDETGWCIGGESPFLDGAPAGGRLFDDDKRHGLLVAEADESDGTLVLYSPEVTVLNNLNFDHVEFFNDEMEMEDTFRGILQNTKRAVVYCIDHARTTSLVNETRNIKTFSFGFSTNADFRISDFSKIDGGSRFAITTREKLSRIISLKVYGRHNILNAAAAITAACSIGIDFEEACQALEDTAALPARRFQKIGNPDNFTVISDFAHHPVEIMALMETVADLKHKRIVAVFQPHRYTRTKTLINKFPEAFLGVDELVLCPVYCASECLMCGGAASDLYKEFRDAAAKNIKLPIPIYAAPPEAAADYVAATLQPGDVVVVIGAGDVHLIADDIAAVKPPKKLPMEVRLGAFGTAALAPKMEVVRTVEDVQAAVQKGEFTVISGGTNSFICPTGCYKTLIRPAGTNFSVKSIVEETDDEVIMDLGCAVQGPSLVRYCLEQGYSGLEFMTGIPGYCGGWLAMNAGTQRGSFCDCVVSADVVTADGSLKTIQAGELGASYRSCPAVADTVVIKIRVRLTKSMPIAVKIAMDDALSARFDFSGLRSGGSAFKNPPPPAKPAGMVLDEAGCKGMRIGGAHVSKDHANVISADQDATASDVYALLCMMRERALTASGILLEPEVRILG